MQRTPLKARNKFTFLFSFLIFGVMFLFTQSQVANAFPMENSKIVSSPVIEYIRLSVPSENRFAWLAAEEKSWEPWLSKKEGFIDRQLLWDQKKEEAILLIRWASREQWKNIPQSEINSVQVLFEKIARDLTHKNSGNPFPITFEGELLPQ